MSLVTAAAGCAGEAIDEMAPGYPALRPAPCTLERTSFRIDRLGHPSRYDELMALAPNVDGDAGDYRDARFTLTRISATDALNIDFQPALDEMVANGDLRWVLHLETCAGGAGDHARVIAEDGEGRESMIASVGTIRDGRVVTADGTALVPAPAFFRVTPTDEIIWLPGSGIAVHLELLPDGSVEGTIGGGVSGTDVDLDPIYAAAAESFNTVVAQDRGCLRACTPRARRLLDLFDEDGSGVIGFDELRVNSIATGMLTPDLDLYADYGTDAQAYWPLRDDELDHLSFAFTFHAVPLSASIGDRGRTEIE